MRVWYGSVIDRMYMKLVGRKILSSFRVKIQLFKGSSV